MCSFPESARRVKGENIPLMEKWGKYNQRSVNYSWLKAALMK